MKICTGIAMSSQYTLMRKLTVRLVPDPEIKRNSFRGTIICIRMTTYIPLDLRLIIMKLTKIYRILYNEKLFTGHRRVAG